MVIVFYEASCGQRVCLCEFSNLVVRMDRFWQRWLRQTDSQTQSVPSQGSTDELCSVHNCWCKWFLWHPCVEECMQCAFFEGGICQKTFCYWIETKWSHIWTTTLQLLHGKKGFCYVWSSRHKGETGKRRLDPETHQLSPLTVEEEWLRPQLLLDVWTQLSSIHRTETDIPRNPIHLPVFLQSWTGSWDTSTPPVGAVAPLQSSVGDPPFFHLMVVLTFIPATSQLALWG